jgi:hypothetical protein
MARRYKTSQEFIHGANVFVTSVLYIYVRKPLQLSHVLAYCLLICRKITKMNNFNVGRNNFRYRNQLFKISFLVFQLVFCSMLLFYILRKSEIGIALADKFFR